MNKQNLQKLIKFVCELAELDGNEWMREELKEKFAQKIDNVIGAPQMDEIYEYCLRKIVTEHAEKFYQDFKLKSIKGKLIEDFIRMEKFRREDKFEDFCLALFQQVEGVVNALSTDSVKQYIFENINTVSYKDKNLDTGFYEERNLKQLIFYFNLTEIELSKKFEKEMREWDFNEKFKSILMYYYFNRKYISNYRDFSKLSLIGYDMHQARNLNHRGGKVTEKQQKTIDKVQTNSHRYYFKFIGFLEDFIFMVNRNIEV